MKIKACIIEFEGEAGAANELLRMVGQAVGIATDLPAIQTEDPPLALPTPRPAPADLCKTGCGKGLTQQVKQTRTAPPKTVNASRKEQPAPADEPAEDRDGDRFAPRNAELQEAIVDYVRLKGPTRVRDLAVAMQRAGQAIGKAVSMCEQLEKDDEGFVRVAGE